MTRVRYEQPHRHGVHADPNWYKSDSDWTKFLRRYRWHVADLLEYSTLGTVYVVDILDSFKATVFGNQALFEGASTTTIREHFQQWATTAIQED
ncbi:hypothetical protein PENFLA_c006G08652 [Penicillium flavigenum]|uniref:Uncharacterized protein n=1 Tax=Penicillium flavigenum TaxID=254877 RepID=A0A1V6TL73_9EURO|nr:hypothetical protein PENFLA_c006G08652 [Penicillium flavigenum]